MMGGEGGGGGIHAHQKIQSSRSSIESMPTGKSKSRCTFSRRRFGPSASCFGVSGLRPRAKCNFKTTATHMMHARLEQRKLPRMGKAKGKGRPPRCRPWRGPSLLVVIAFLLACSLVSHANAAVCSTSCASDCEITNRDQAARAQTCSNNNKANAYVYTLPNDVPCPANSQLCFELKGKATFVGAKAGSTYTSISAAGSGSRPLTINNAQADVHMINIAIRSGLPYVNALEPTLGANILVMSGKLTLTNCEIASGNYNNVYDSYGGGLYANDGIVSFVWAKRQRAPNRKTRRD